jgi:hypothetical protein
LVGIWPRLKREKIENIRFCFTISPQAGHIDRHSISHNIIKILSFHKRDATIVKWWTHYREVPKECLPECISIIDKALKGARWRRLIGAYSRVLPLSKMLVVTKKGKYIFDVEIEISTTGSSCVYGVGWKSNELGEYLKRCGLRHTRYFVPPKEKTIAILLFPPVPRGSALLDSPLVALFGDKKIAEDLLYGDKNGSGNISGDSFKPKIVFEDRDQLEKIIDAYDIAFKEAEKKQFRSKGCSFNGFIVFITPDEFYWKVIGIGDKYICGDYMISEQLKAYFDELGLTSELLAENPQPEEHPAESKDANTLSTEQ